VGARAAAGEAGPGAERAHAPHVGQFAGERFVCGGSQATAALFWAKTSASWFQPAARCTDAPSTTCVHLADAAFEANQRASHYLLLFRSNGAPPSIVRCWAAQRTAAEMLPGRQEWGRLGHLKRGGGGVALRGHCDGSSAMVMVWAKLDTGALASRSPVLNGLPASWRACLPPGLQAAGVGARRLLERDGAAAVLQKLRELHVDRAAPTLRTLTHTPLNRIGTVRQHHSRTSIHAHAPLQPRSAPKHPPIGARATLRRREPAAARIQAIAQPASTRRPPRRARWTRCSLPLPSRWAC
jgi:hypothetical protein